MDDRFFALPFLCTIYLGQPSTKLILSGPGQLGPDQCPMAVNKSPADGTVCFFRCRICLHASLT